MLEHRLQRSKRWYTGVVPERIAGQGSRIGGAWESGDAIPGGSDQQRCPLYVKYRHSPFPVLGRGSKEVTKQSLTEEEVQGRRVQERNQKDQQLQQLQQEQERGCFGQQRKQWRRRG